MATKFTATLLLGLFTSSLALADKMGPNGDKFYEEAAHFENACSEELCKAPYSQQVVYNQSSKLNKLSVDTKNVLKSIAFEQAQIWGDTILEGDYHAAGRTRLDLAIAYYKDNQLVGYKISYSQKAWETSECNFDGTKQSLKDCKEGRIIEGSYVSPDAQTYFSDEERYAEFSLGAN